MDLNFYSDLTDGTGQSDAEFLDVHSFNGFDADHKFPGGSDNYLTMSGSGHPFLSTAETFHTPSLGDEEFEIPPISLDPDSALVSHFGGLSDPGASEGTVEGSVVEGDDPTFASTYGSAQGLDHLNLAVMSQAGNTLLGGGLSMDLGHSMASQFGSSSPVTIDVGLLGSSQLTTIDQSELSTHLGLGLSGGPLLPRATEENPLSATASPTSSLHDDDMDDFRSVLVESPISLSVSPGVISVDPSLSDPSSAGYSSVSPAPGRRAVGGKKPKRKKDPNEPQKPVSAYALFFRDTQAAIKGQNPNATFGEVSKIVASMWDSLAEEQKQVYKRKNEIAKKEYLKALAEYRASQLNATPIEVMDTSPSPSPPDPAPPPPITATTVRTTRSQQYNPEENTITNICASNIIVDLPQVTTRSRTGAIKPTPLPPDSPTSEPEDTPTVTKIIIKSTPLPSGGVSVTASPAPSTRQPPPLSAPPPPRLAPPTLQTPPPPLQAKPRGTGTAVAAAKAPPPLQIKQIKVVLRPDAVAVVKREEPVALEVGGGAAVKGEAEEGMEVEVTVAPGPTAPPSISPSVCVRAGCTNRAVESQDWDREYCSNECVATHCRDVFMAWCAIRGQNSTTVT
ncbi:unnamed protein product [Knipowitschia caucasica]